MPDVVTIGETMLRLSAPPGMSLEQTPHFTVLAAGAESNAAIALARIGTSAGWISRLPDNPLGRRIVREIRAHGVDVSRVRWATEGRVGTYYLEPGAAPRSSLLIYDRAHSAFAAISPDEVDWEYMTNAKVLHLTGITPALSPACRTLAARARDEARRAEVLISFDVNYREKLWPAELARAALSPLLDHAGVIFSTRGDAELLLERSGSAADLCGKLADRYHARVSIVTDGAACAAAADGKVLVKEGVAVEPIDPIGAGDAFAAGFLHGYLAEGVERGLEYALAVAALQLTYYGDVAWITPQNVQTLLSGLPRWR